MTVACIGSATSYSSFPELEVKQGRSSARPPRNKHASSARTYLDTISDGSPVVEGVLKTYHLALLRVRKMTEDKRQRTNHTDMVSSYENHCAFLYKLTLKSVIEETTRRRRRTSRDEHSPLGHARQGLTSRAFTQIKYHFHMIRVATYVVDSNHSYMI